MSVIIIGPRRIVRRGMKRTIQDLGTHVTDPAVHEICEKRSADWTPEEVSYVQSEIDRHKDAED